MSLNGGPVELTVGWVDQDSTEASVQTSAVRRHVVAVGAAARRKLLTAEPDHRLQEESF